MDVQLSACVALAKVADEGVDDDCGVVICIVVPVVDDAGVVVGGISDGDLALLAVIVVDDINEVVDGGRDTDETGTGEHTAAGIMHWHDDMLIVEQSC